MKNTLIAYHNKPELKAKYIARVQEHRRLDELHQGATAGRTADGKFRGCAVVCTMECYSHGAYEKEIGVSRVLAKLEDGIFEGLDQANAMAWPEEFLDAIPVGANLSNVMYQFLFWLIADKTEGVIRFAKTDKQRVAIAATGQLFRRKIAGETITSNEWWKAGKAATADAAADDAAYAAYAADAAYAAYAADAAAYAAYAYAAADAAAAAAGYAAYAAAAAAGYYAAACYKARSKQAEKLIELLKAAPVLAK